jgi:hypothetical protein
MKSILAGAAIIASLAGCALNPTDGAQVATPPAAIQGSNDAQGTPIYSGPAPGPRLGIGIGAGSWGGRGGGGIGIGYGW